MKETILIVDDEERMRTLIAAYLKKEEYNVLQAENGINALRVLKENKVQVLILDVMMPLMDGWTCCTEIRKTSNIPIIMLTAKAEDEDKLLGFELGIDKYVTKPFSPKVLVAEVKSLIKRIYNKDEATKKDDNYDGLSIDKLSYRVTVDEKEIYLSPKEFELLLYFVINKGIVLSREKILDSVWGMDYFGELRTVDTNIKRLREKLGEKAYLISTVRGTGYKFEVKNEI